MGWDERRGQVSRSFDEWKGVDDDIRAYLTLGHRWTSASYERTWEEAQQEFAEQFDPDRHDPEGHVDVFDDKVFGLWQKTFLWMFRTGALRDAVTAFEVYLEKSAREVLDGYHFEDSEGGIYKLEMVTSRGHLSPSWLTLVKVHLVLGSSIETRQVQYIRSLRHLLAHQRGQLRSEEQRSQYERESDAEDWLVGDARVGGDLPLRQERVTDMLNDLAVVVRDCDQAVWAHTYGGVRLPTELKQLTVGKRPCLTWAPLVSRPL